MCGPKETRFVCLFICFLLFLCSLVCLFVRWFVRLPVHFSFFPFSALFLYLLFFLFMLYFSLYFSPFLSFLISLILSSILSFVLIFLQLPFRLLLLWFSFRLFFFFSSNHQGGDNSPRLLKSIRPLNLPILTDHSHETQEEHGIPQESEPNGPGAEYGADEAALGGGESWKKIDANELKHIGSFGDQRLVFTYDAGTSTSINHVWTGTTQAQAQEGTRACACVVPVHTWLMRVLTLVLASSV